MPTISPALPSPALRLFARAERAPDAPCVVDAAGTHDFRAIADGARRVAAAIGGPLGGERVAILVSPGAAFVEAFFGVLAAGGCAVVLSPLHPPAEDAFFCDDALVRRLVVSRDLAQKAAPLADGRRVVDVDDARRAAPNARALSAPAGTDAALQLYTSGTTGKPKGAILSHANLAIQQDLLGDAWGWSERDVLLHALPLHHLHGLGIALLTALGAGAAARMLAFDAPKVWDAMREATVFMAVPTMYTKLFAAFDAADDAMRARWAEGARALRLATSGSAALPVTLGERWRRITGNYPLERFGMTEVGVALTNPLRGERRPGTVGFPLPTVETRIVGDGGADAESGELWVRGPSVFSGYWKRADGARAAAAFDPRSSAGVPAVDGHGWFKTGDTVTRDADGYVKILGRTSVDILKSGGYKLSALEIEEVLREHPGVAEVAVVGVPDETWGERVVACVVPRAGHDEACGEAALRAFAKERLASYKVPKNVVLARELPRNALGKVKKPDLVRELVARAACAADGGR